MKLKILILTCFLSLVLSNPSIIGGDDHDKTANQITTLISKLHKKSLGELRNFALSLESYRTNGEMVFGGLHDYIEQYNEQSLIKYIISVCIEKRELLDEQKFNSVISDFSPSFKNNTNIEKTFISESLNSIKSEEPENSESIFEDIVLIQSRDRLIKWALTAEYHDNLKKQASLVGSLHDYVETLSDKEISDFILRIVDVYPELGSKLTLERLEEEYEIKYESKNEDDDIEDKKDVIEKSTKSLNFLADPEPEGEGGLVDFIFRLSREMLTEYAFTVEKYHHETDGLNIKGGIVDYVDDLNNEQIAWFVLDIAKKYPELNSKEFLDALVYRYGIDKVIT